MPRQQSKYGFLSDYIDELTISEYMTFVRWFWREYFESEQQKEEREQLERIAYINENLREMAATKIQVAYRAKRARRETHRLNVEAIIQHSAARHIQRAVRQLILRRHTAASQIQQAFRHFKRRQNAVFVLSRAVRKYLFRKHKADFGLPRDPDSFDESFKAILLSAKVALHPLPPMYRNAVDPELAEQWINLHPASMQNMARKLISAVDYISFAHFMRRLRVSINDFNETMMSLPPDERHYAIVIGDQDLYGDKSNSWTIALALPYLAKLPNAIVHNYIEYLGMHPEIRHLLIIDDAAYSGMQLYNLIYRDDSLRKAEVAILRRLTPNLTLHLAVPFMTTRAIIKIEYGKYDPPFDPDSYYKVIQKPKIKFHAPQIILSVEQRLKHPINIDEECPPTFFSSDEYSAFRYAERRTDKSLTYFAHKVPDAFTTYTIISDGYLIGREQHEGAIHRAVVNAMHQACHHFSEPVPQEYQSRYYQIIAQQFPPCQFIPSTTEPYKLTEDKWADRLRSNIENGTVSHGQVAVRGNDYYFNSPCGLFRVRKTNASGTEPPSESRLQHTLHMTAQR